MIPRGSAVFVPAFVVGLSIDAWTKAWAETALPGRPVNVFSDILRLSYATNDGVAFSAPITGWPLKILTVALIAYAAAYYLKEEPRRGRGAVDAAYAAFFAGAVWNAVERIGMGRVTDFIDLKYFANFNVADMMICVSAACIAAFHLWHERTDQRRPVE